MDNVNSECFVAKGCGQGCAGWLLHKLSLRSRRCLLVGLVVQQLPTISVTTAPTRTAHSLCPIAHVAVADCPIKNVYFDPKTEFDCECACVSVGCRPVRRHTRASLPNTAAAACSSDSAMSSGRLYSRWSAKQHLVCLPASTSPAANKQPLLLHQPLSNSAACCLLFDPADKASARFQAVLRDQNVSRACYDATISSLARCIDRKDFAIKYGCCSQACTQGFQKVRNTHASHWRGSTAADCSTRMPSSAQAVLRSISGMPHVQPAAELLPLQWLRVCLNRLG